MSNDRRARLGTRLSRMAQRGKLRVWRRRIGAIVSVVILVAVAVALSRPAITMGSAPTCGLREHVHGSACYDEGGMLVCTVTEHRHTEACKTPSDEALDGGPAATSDNATQTPAPAANMGEEPVQAVAPNVVPSDDSVGNESDGTMGEEPIATPDGAKDESGGASGTMGEEAPRSASHPDEKSKNSLVARVDGYVVSVAYDADAGIDEGTTLEARPIDTQSDEHAEYLARAMDALGNAAEEADDYEARFFDITLVSDGREVEPQADVRVTISGDDVPAKSANAEAQVVHFGDAGTEVIGVQATQAAEGMGVPRTAYTFEQGSFSVSGLLIRNPDVATGSIPRGAQLAKQRSLRELENGAVYVIYTIMNGNPYAVGSNGALHEMRRSADGGNVYPVGGGTIDTSWLWMLDRKNTVSNGVKATIVNALYSNTILYPRTLWGSCVEEGTAKALITPINGTDWEFNVCDNGGTLGVNANDTDWTYTDQTKRAFYFAEVPTESTHTATQVNEAELLEGYYVISRYNAPSASSTGITTMGHDLTYRSEASGAGTNKIQGIRTNEIWFVQPNEDGTYTMRNLWSGERLSPTAGTTTDTLNITWVSSSSRAYQLTSAELGKSLRSGNGFATWWSSAANFFLYRVDDDGYYHTYFDTSMGGNAFYKYTANRFASHVQYTLGEVDGSGTPCHTIVLPTAEEVGTTGTEGSSKPYHYKLKGWVDIYDHSYYYPGSTATVYGNAVFYPDWEAESYDIGQAQDLSSKSVYMPAITTTMFDYNELSNAFSLEQLSNANDDIHSYGHSDRWKDSLRDDSFIFFFNDGRNKTSLHNVNAYDRADWNSSSSSTPGDGGDYTGHYNGDVTAGILDRNPGLRDQLFSQDTWMLGKTYVGADHYLYSYDDDTGYYYYDSNRNAASYNRHDGRFYVYNYTNLTNKSKIASDSWKDNTDFLPLNYGNEMFTEASGDVNYWFGMKTEFHFFLPNDATTDGTKNKSIKNDDMAFRFSGDDDVWVLVDDQLVLDLGGVHGTVYGEINFSKCTVTTGQSGADAVYELKDGTTTKLASDATQQAIATDSIKVIGINGDVGVASSVNDLLANLKAGAHKLTFLYLERGASESNASIYFNIAPVYQVNLSKVDGTNGSTTPLTGAKFKVYADQACTKEATSVSVRMGKPYDAVNGYQDTDGMYYFDGFAANQDYYIKEIEAPKGYRLLSGPVRVSINGETITCTYIPTNEQGRPEEGQVVCVASLEDQGTNFSGVYGGFAIQIPNYTGKEIPAAGGFGTTPLVVAGAVLVTSSAVVLVFRRRARGGVRT